MENNSILQGPCPSENKSVIVSKVYNTSFQDPSSCKDTIKDEGEGKMLRQIYIHVKQLH